MLQKKYRWLLAFIIALLLFTVFSYFKYQKNVNTAVDPKDDTKISFTIKKGESVDKIGTNLMVSNLINSDSSFSTYVSWNGFDKKILAGRFFLKKNMTTKEIVVAITDAKNAEFLITIQEGLTIRDIDQKLVDLELIKAGEFMQAVKDFNGWQYYPFLDQKTLSQLNLPLEGYLYPDTYFLDPSTFKPHKLIYLALDNFENKTAELLPQLKKHSVHQIVTMASIIEDEVYGTENRKIVSGILWKRLESSWPLGADATLLYGKNNHIITAEDLNTDSPYNTRKNQGLPPGPISSPSISSIEAAMFPKDSPYWFYLTDKEGNVIYASSNEEHNQNRAKYL
jgi:UPF0755 protein